MWGISGQCAANNLLSEVKSGCWDKINKLATNYFQINIKCTETNPRTKKKMMQTTLSNYMQPFHLMEKSGGIPDVCT